MDMVIAGEDLRGGPLQELWGLFAADTSLLLEQEEIAIDSCMDQPERLIPRTIVEVFEAMLKFPPRPGGAESQRKMCSLQAGLVVHPGLPSQPG